MEQTTTEARQISDAAHRFALWRNLSRDPSLREALFTFLLTRGLIFFVFVLTTSFSFMDKPASPGEFQETRIALGSVGRHLRPLAVRADGEWYEAIAREGYTRIPFETTRQHNWAFFPLYPLLLRLAATLTGGFKLTGLALSNPLFFFALLLLHKMVGAFGYDGGVADRTIFYISIFPTSYFFSLNMSESLFLLLTVGAFYAARRDAWWLAGATGALATATRFSGILLLPVLLILYWQRYGLRPRWNALYLLLVPVGLLAFMFYLYTITGNPFAFKDILVTWGRRPGLFVRPLLNYLANFGVLDESWDFYFLNFAAAMTAFVCGFSLLKRREWAFAFYTLGSTIIPLSSLKLQSVARYMVVVFPIFIVLAMAGAGRALIERSALYSSSCSG